MLRIVVCEDNQQFLELMNKTVNSFMMNYEIDYELLLFTEFDDDFEKVVADDNGFKIFFLDLVTTEGSGLDAARMIREKYDDWVSIIIIVTSHEEYRFEALSTRLALFDFINKMAGCSKEIRKALERAISNYDKREKTLSFEFNHICHKVEFRHIIYIEKEQDSKRCLIHTTYGDKIMSASLNTVLKNLDKRFMKVHRSFIVNIDQITSYELNKNRITFKDGSYSYLVARDKKKELLIRVRTNY